MVPWQLLRTASSLITFMPCPGVVSLLHEAKLSDHVKGSKLLRRTSKLEWLVAVTGAEPKTEKDLEPFCQSTECSQKLSSIEGSAEFGLEWPRTLNQLSGNWMLRRLLQSFHANLTGFLEARTLTYFAHFLVDSPFILLSQRRKQFKQSLRCRTRAGKARRRTCAKACQSLQTIIRSSRRKPFNQEEEPDLSPATAAILLCAAASVAVWLKFVSPSLPRLQQSSPPSPQTP